MNILTKKTTNIFNKNCILFQGVFQWPILPPFQARAQDFPQGGGRKFKIKSFGARDFFRPPEKFSPTLRGGGEIFSEGGENPEESYKFGDHRAPIFFRQILLKYWS